MPNYGFRLYLPGVTKSNRAGQFYICAAVLILAAVVLGCAQQGAPGGGPPDTAPPTVEATIPASGDVMVSRSTSLTFQFSEPVEKSAFASALQISPARSGAPRLEWSNGGRRVEVVWADTLRDSTSYRVTVSNQLTDRRANKLAEPFNLAFSTGPHVDRGEIRGRIVTSGEKSSAFDVFAYNASGLPDTFWMANPDYTTQSAADGRFALPFLRSGIYRVLVLVDANRNKKLDHGEQVAIATRDYDVADDRAADSSMWFPFVHDTVPLSLRECSGTATGLLHLTFSHPLDTSGQLQWRINIADSTKDSIESRFTIIPPTQRRPNAIALVGTWDEGQSYTITARGFLDQRGEFLDSASCSCLYVPHADTTLPRIEAAILPTAATALSPRTPTQFVFTEPVDTAQLFGAATVRDTLGEEIAGAWSWRDPQLWRFDPDGLWPDSNDAVITVDSSRIVDQNGNRAGAGVYQWRFVPVGGSRMGELELRVEPAPPGEAQVWVELRAVGDSRYTRTSVPQSGILSLSLPAGKWLLYGFIDLNADGRWSHGGVQPYAHSETRVLHPDTLDIRARFTLEDVVLRF